MISWPCVTLARDAVHFCVVQPELSHLESQVPENSSDVQEAQQWEVKSEQKQYWSDYSWGQVYFGATAVLYDCTGDAFYAKRLAYFADSHLNSKNGIKRTPCGLSFVTKWGSCRHAAGCAGILATYARGLLKKNPKSPVALEILNFAERQV